MKVMEFIVISVNIRFSKIHTRFEIRAVLNVLRFVKCARKGIYAIQMTIS